MIFVYFQRFTQYLASSNSNFQLNSFLDKGGVQGKKEYMTGDKGVYGKLKYIIWNEGVYGKLEYIIWNKGDMVIYVVGNLKEDKITLSYEPIKHVHI